MWRDLTGGRSHAPFESEVASVHLERVRPFKVRVLWVEVFVGKGRDNRNHKVVNGRRQGLGVSCHTEKRIRALGAVMVVQHRWDGSETINHRLGIIYCAPHGPLWPIVGHYHAGSPGFAHRPALGASMIST